MNKPAFNSLDAVAVPLDRRNVDTDQIIPARFLRKPRAAGMAAYLFHDLRWDPEGRERADFILNEPLYRDAKILVARENFGSGSSREAAVYALWDFGFKVVIAPSFGDIFSSNALKNGLLPVSLPTETVDALLAELSAHPAMHIQVDLMSQTVSAGASLKVRFEIDPFQKKLLLSGQDELGYTLDLAAKVSAFEAARANREPWL